MPSNINAGLCGNFNTQLSYMKKALVISIILFAFTYSIAQTQLTPVVADSKIHFVIKNFGLNTSGDFSGLKGTIQFDPSNISTALFDVSIDPKTINTDNGMRDNHLRKAEFFDVEKHNSITFKSTKVTNASKSGRYAINGELTIKGVTKPVGFEFGVTPKEGGYVFDGEFEINRRDFGVGGSSISMADMLKVSLSVFAKK